VTAEAAAKTEIEFDHYPDSALKRPMFLIAIAFLIGHCLLHGLTQLPSLQPWLPLLFALGVGSACMTRWRRMRFLAAMLLSLACGFGSAWWHAEQRMAERWPVASSGVDVELRGYIASIVEEREDGRRFLVDVLRSDRSIPKHIELTWYDTEIAPRPGELWQLRARLRSPHGFANPGGYDYEAQLLRNAIGATGYVREDSFNRRLAEPGGSYFVLRTRAWIADQLAAALPNSPMIGIVQGLAVGETSRMQPAQWRVFANTGTTHLMAISGMHIGMVALLLAYLGGRIAGRLRLQATRISVIAVQSLTGMGAAIAYSALAGLSVPTQRTLIMLCVFFGARLLRRQVAPAQGLAVALTAVLLMDPFAPLAPGFWLSFGAVAALFLAGAGRLGMHSKTREYFRAQTVVTIGLAPLLIGVFGNLSLISPLVNLVAIPFFTLLVVPLVLIATFLLTISHALGTLVLQAADRLLVWTWPALEWASQLPMAMWPLPHAPWWAFTLLVAGACLMLSPGVWATRMAGLLLCLPAICWQPPHPQFGEFELTMLDVGQGLAVAIRTAHHVLVYDTGPNFRGGRDTGELVVVPFLHALGVRATDAVVVSHADADHIGGLRSLLASVPTGRLLIGPSIESQAHSEFCAQGQQWHWDEVQFEILYPRGDGDSTQSVRGKRRNDSSCVLFVRGAGGSAILLGDVEARAEHQLVVDKLAVHADVVIVPHHGSRTSSSAELVAAIAPQYALISAGFGNRFGFPKQEVVERWRDHGAQIFQTASGGAVEITVARQGVLAPHAYRLEERRYWWE